MQAFKKTSLIILYCVVFIKEYHLYPYNPFLQPNLAAKFISNSRVTKTMVRTLKLSAKKYLI